jgi:hypothetical protein
MEGMRGRFRGRVAFAVIAAALGCTALPVTRSGPALAAGTPLITVGTTSPSSPTLAPSLLGADIAAITNSRLYDPSAVNGVFSTASTVAAGMHLGYVRMSPMVNLGGCSGGQDCTYHFRSQTPGAALPSDPPPNPADISPDAWYAKAMALESNLSSAMIVVNIEAGSIAEAQDFIAYMNGATTDQRPLSDNTTVAHWANLRVTNNSPPSTFTHTQAYGIKYWELGNEETIGLHACGSTDYSANCVDSPPSAPLTCSSDSGAALYACLAEDYGKALHTVDGFATIVADYDLNFVPALAQSASDQVGAFDWHEYQPESSPYNTTFDTDNQSASYTFSVPNLTGAMPKNVDYALWATVNGAIGHLDVTLDGVPYLLKTQPCSTCSTDTTSSAVGTGAWASEPQIFYFRAVTDPSLQHTLKVTACLQADTTAGVCTPKTFNHLALNLHLVTTSIDPNQTATWSDLHFIGDGGNDLQANNTYQTAAVDTATTTTSGQPGTATGAGSPSRVSLDEDYPISTLVAASDYVDGDLSRARSTIDNAPPGVFAGTPLIVGEYALWSGSPRLPRRLDASQVSALWDAVAAEHVIADAAADHVVAAGQFQMDAIDGGDCYSLWMISTVLSPSGWCNPTDNAYPSAVGVSFQQLGHLGGAIAPVTTSNVPTVNMHEFGSYTGTPGQAASLQVIATQSGNQVTLLVVNLCPPPVSGETDQCTTPGPTVQVSVPSTISSASALSASAPPYAENFDGPLFGGPTTSTTSITPQAVTGLGFSGTTLTLPLQPMSSTVIQITM